MAKKNFVVPIIALLSVLGMTGCEKAAPTSAPSIGENGNWWVDGTDTGVAAQGPKGDTGASPTISINEDGYWVINGTATDVKAEGTAGAPGQTPSVSINTDGFWVINGVATDVSAQGPKGDPGTTPTVSINADGFWVINGTATEVKAEGTQGAPGSSPTVEIGIDDCWWINGVSTGMPAVAHDGNPGAPGAPGDPGATGPEGKSAFEIFMEHYPHYTGTEADWIKGVADGSLAANMPKAGHSGDWSYDPTTGKIVRTCDICGDTETKDASLPDFVSFDVTEDGVEGFFEVINDDSHPWIFDSAAGTWKSNIKDQHGVSSSLKIKSLVEGSSATFHVLASCEGGSYDNFSTSVLGNASSDLSGSIGSETGVERDVTFTFGDKDTEGTLTYKKDSSVSKGQDGAVVSNFVFKIPTGKVEVADRPAVIVVNFDAGNGDADTQEVVWSGSSVELPTPTKAGYSFVGWFSDAECTIPAPATFDASCTLHAKWVVRHKVTIVEPTPGADDLVVSVDHNDVLDIETPTDDEKLFGGFYILPSCAPGSEFDITSPIKRDTTIYCKWDDAPAYCGSYGGSYIYGLAYGYNSEATLTIAPDGTMSGNKYTGKVTGYDESDGTLIVEGSPTYKLYVVDDMIIGISDLNNADYFNVFVKNREPASSSNNEFILNTAISGTGASANNKGRIFSVNRDEVITNYCIFDGVFYSNVTVTSLDGDFTVGTRADQYGKDICVKDEDGNVITTQIGQVSVDADYGMYTDADSNVLKIYGNGSKASLNGEAITYSKSGDVLSYIEGYVVTEYKSKQTSGWSTKTGTMEWDETEGAWKHTINSVVTVTSYTDPSIVWESTSDNYFAYKSANYGSVSVTLNKVNGSFVSSRPTFTVTKHVGSSSSEIVLRDGNTCTLGTPEIAENQAFLGWFTNPEFTGEPVTEMTTSGDVYAKIVTTFKMTVHKNLTDDPTVSEEIVFNEGEMMDPPVVGKDGSTLVGWFTDSACTVAYVPAAAAAYVEIWAKWDAGKYTNNAANAIDAADPTGSFIQSINFETDYPWTTGTKNNIECICANSAHLSKASSDISIVAKADFWFSADFIRSSEAGYDYLKVYVDGVEKADTKGSSGSNGIGTTGSLQVYVGAGQTLTLSFYQDSGSWQGDNTIYLHNLAFTAPETVTVTYHYMDGATANKAVSGTKNATFSPETPSREGFAFLGWFTDELYGTAFDSTAALTGNVDLYAKWYDLSLAVGTTKEDAVSIGYVDDYYDKEDYSGPITLVPGQTDLWISYEATESHGASAGSNYLYMLVDNPTAFKSKITNTTYFLNDDTEGTEKTFYVYNSYSYFSIGSGTIYTVGNKVYFHIELSGITEVTTLSFAMYA